MDALGMLNALIGLSLVYFVLSLIVSAVVEWITQLRGYRGKVLEQATARLLGLDAAPGSATLAAEPAKGASVADADFLTGAFHAFFDHPQFRPCRRTRPASRPTFPPAPTPRSLARRFWV
jgi:hypothetical protein